jgi:hypothetical protein
MWKFWMSLPLADLKHPHTFRLPFARSEFPKNLTSSFGFLQFFGFLKILNSIVNRSGSPPAVHQQGFEAIRAFTIENIFSKVKNYEKIENKFFGGG